MKLGIVEIFKEIYFVYKWRKENKHNSTRPISVFPIDKVHVGRGTYGRLDIETYGTSNANLRIGSFCSIARDVRFLLDGEHDYSKVSTYPFKVYYGEEKCEAKSKGEIVVEDDVWIGERVLVMSGVTIGQGAIISAGSIVIKDVPPYAIYTTGRIIKYRFCQDIIDKLIKFDFSSLNNEEIITRNIDLLYSEVEDFVESDFYKQHRKE